MACPDIIYELLLNVCHIQKNSLDSVHCSSQNTQIKWSSTVGLLVSEIIT